VAIIAACLRSSGTSSTQAPSSLRLDVDAAHIRGTWVKHAPPSLPPLPSRTDAPDNRWQRGGVVDAIYLADNESTVWAEWYRHLAENGLPPAQALPRELWRWQIDVEVADVSTEARLVRVGLTLPAPGRHTWPSFQQVGEQLWSEGWRGLIAPSAARPAGAILCLFWEGEAEIDGAEPQSPPERIDDPPAPPTGMTT
jgi:RES domain-containing protein